MNKTTIYYGIIIIILIIIFYNVFKSKTCSSDHELYQNKHCIKLCNDGSSKLGKILNNKTIQCMYDENIESISRNNGECEKIPNLDRKLFMFIDINVISKEYNNPTYLFASLEEDIDDSIEYEPVNLEISEIIFISCENLKIFDLFISPAFEYINLYPIIETKNTSSNIYEYNLNHKYNIYPDIKEFGISVINVKIDLKKIHPLKIIFEYNNEYYYIVTDIKIGNLYLFFVEPTTI